MTGWSDMLGSANFSIDANVTPFAAQFNRSSFAFSHTLHTDPLFSLESIAELARRRRGAPALAYWSNGTVGIDGTWAQGTEHQMSLEHTVAQLATNDSLVLLKRIEQDARFGPMVRGLLDGIVAMAGDPLRKDVTEARATLLLASPGRVTSYHIDADTNYLFQLQGDKLLYVHRHTDRTLLTEDELERFFCGDINAPTFKPQRAAEAACYRLQPGDAVHIPSTAPHWARVSNDVSVALSVNFDLASMRRHGHAYRFNRRLRKLGGSPRPPGESPMGDACKAAAYVAARTLRHPMR